MAKPNVPCESGPLPDAGQALRWRLSGVREGSGPGDQAGFRPGDFGQIQGEPAALRPYTRLVMTERKEKENNINNSAWDLLSLTLAGSS